MSLDRVGEQAVTALGELIAPPLLWSEVPSVLHELAFRSEISQELAEHALERFLEGKLGIVERRPDGLARTWQLAGEFGWAKTYDAEYLATAELLGCKLVTADARLRRGADRLGYVFTPAELLEGTPAPSDPPPAVDRHGQLAADSVAAPHASTRLLSRGRRRVGRSEWAVALACESSSAGSGSSRPRVRSTRAA